MKRIMIGMKAEHATKLANELLMAYTNPGERSVFIYGESNNRNSEEIIIEISNDDMERNEVPADAVYVDIEDD